MQWRPVLGLPHTPYYDVSAPFFLILPGWLPSHLCCVPRLRPEAWQKPLVNLVNAQSEADAFPCHFPLTTSFTFGKGNCFWPPASCSSGGGAKPVDHQLNGSPRELVITASCRAHKQLAVSIVTDPAATTNAGVLVPSWGISVTSFALLKIIENFPFVLRVVSKCRRFATCDIRYYTYCKGKFLAVFLDIIFNFLVTVYMLTSFRN